MVITLYHSVVLCFYDYIINFLQHTIREFVQVYVVFTIHHAQYSILTIKITTSTQIMKARHLLFDAEQCNAFAHMYTQKM